MQHQHLARAASVEQDIAAGYAALHAGDIRRAEYLFRHAVTVDVRSVDGWLGLATTQSGARHAVCLRWATYVEDLERHAAERSVPTRAAQPRPPRTRARTIGPVLAAAMLLALVGRDLAYRDRVLPGVVVGSVNVGNLPRVDAAARLRQWEQQIAERQIDIRIGARHVRVPAGSLLLTRSSAVAEALSTYGHEPWFWQRALTYAQALAGHEYRLDAPQVDLPAVQALVAQLARESRQHRRDAQLVRTEQGWSIMPEQAGHMIDVPGAVKQMRQAVVAATLTQPDTPLVVSIPVATEVPARTQATLEPLRARLETLRTTPLLLQLGDRNWTLDRSMLIDLDRSLVAGTLQPSNALIAQHLEPIASAIAIAPEPSRLVRRGDRVQQIVLGQNGQEVDRPAAVTAIARGLTTNAPQVMLPMRAVAPPPGEVEQLGLVAELGRGESQFASYTSPARDANVQVGGNDIDGVLLAPGAVFSFTQTVGAITEAKGYQWGEAIEAGVVVPSLGGGICQVSTTTFRAALWSGLEIVERYNHSWRLPWYEVDSLPGLDATIALGGPDLKFRNDTSRYILIKVETDLTRKRQTVIIYGTPDGRRVEVQPVTDGTIGIDRDVIDATGNVRHAVFISNYSQ